MSEHTSEYQREEIMNLVIEQRTYNAVQQAIVFLRSLGMQQQHIARLLNEPQPAISQYMRGRNPGKTMMMNLYTILEQDFPDRLAFEWQNRAKEEAMKALEKAILAK